MRFGRESRVVERSRFSARASRASARFRARSSATSFGPSLSELGGRPRPICFHIGVPRWRWRRSRRDSVARVVTDRSATLPSLLPIPPSAERRLLRLVRSRVDFDAVPSRERTCRGMAGFDDDGRTRPVGAAELRERDAPERDVPVVSAARRRPTLCGALWAVDTNWPLFVRRPRVAGAPTLPTTWRSGTSTLSSYPSVSRRRWVPIGIVDGSTGDRFRCCATTPGRRSADAKCTASQIPTRACCAARAVVLTSRGGGTVRTLCCTNATRESLQSSAG